MKSNILSLRSYYSKFENILPEELPSSLVEEELRLTKDEVNKIINEDLEKLKNLSLKEGIRIRFDDFRNPDHIIKTAFFMTGDEYQEVLHNYAHWTMASLTLQVLTSEIIDLSMDLKKFYVDYISRNDNFKRSIFSHFIHTYQDFNGYLVNIYNTIIQYYDLFVLTCNKIDSNNKESPIFGGRSATDPSQLLSSVKELLLNGNEGRLVGFPLLRSALEVYITRNLFNLESSRKYQNFKLVFKKGKFPSPNKIRCKLEKLHLNQQFKTDSLRRLYEYESVVAHRGYRTDEYLIWFVYHHTILGIMNAFNANLEEHRDQIIEELQKDGQIELRKKNTDKKIDYIY